MRDKEDKETTRSNRSDNEDYYFENGLMVMTEQYHLKRGVCCGSKCRHCPYDHENVEPS